MNDNVMRGRAVGAAMAASFVIELVSNFRWQTAIFGGAGFLENAGRQPAAVGMVIVMGLLTGLLSLGVSAVLAGAYGRDFPAHAWFNLALGAVTLATSLVELSGLHVMRTLSDQFLQAGPDAGDRYQVAASVVRALRNGVHFGTKLLEGVGMLSFFALLWRARAVPRALAAFGLLASAPQGFAVTQPLFAGEVIYPLLAPLALAYLATFAWLLAKGLPAARQ